jgi:hypothetical protein
MYSRLEEVKAWCKEIVACQEVVEACVEKMKASLREIEAAVETGLEKTSSKKSWTRLMLQRRPL